MTTRHFLWAAALTLTVASVAMAQSRATTADVTGTVLDQTNAALPGATVTATNTATNTVRSTTTDGQGRFAIPALPPGTYTVTCELTGFTTEKAEQVTLTLGEWHMLEFNLRVAGTTEEVRVSVQAPLVDIQNTSVSSVVSQDQIESLPINGRNFISFSIITPGVTVDQTPQQGASATSGLTFAGQRARSNNITVDGLDNNDITLGSVRATFSQEAVREFQVLTSSYSSEFGKASGGVVNIVTKSGSNTTSGNIFGFFRDDALNAKNYFEKFDPAGNALDQDKAPYSHKQWGGTLGGPIVRNRTFYFASFERLDVDANNFVNIDNTTIVRHPITGAALGTPLQIINNAGFPVADGNQPYGVVTDSFLVKADHEMRSGQSLAVRYNYGDNLNENIEPFGGQIARSRGAFLDSSDNMLALSHTGIFRDKWVNELRFQYARRVQDVVSLDPRCNGECDLENEGGPTLEIIGVASVGRQRFTPTPRTNDRYQFLDTISVFKGSHQLKGGIDFNIVKHTDQALPLHFGGRYIFVPYSAAQSQAILGAPIPVSSIQAVALGLPGRYVQGYGVSGTEYGYHDISLFAQDEWQLSNRLTLKMGLRYQNQSWPSELSYQVAGYPGAYGFPSDGNNLAPRLAFAWDPAGNGRMSVHASYGIFYDNHITSMSGIALGINGDTTGVRTLVAGPPTSFSAWAQPSRTLPASAVPPFPSLEISIDPGLKTPWAHHTSIGINRELGGEVRLSADYVNLRGSNQVGTIDYNPVVPSLGAGRRPEDVNGVAGTSASILQYTSWGHTWYDGFTLALNKRFNGRHQFLASYTLSKAEDESTDFQSAFVPQNNGQGRNDADATGLPIGFSAGDERGPSLQDQRHRFVLSGLYVAPKDVRVSSIITVASGRPYNVLAGTDLNGDGDGGAFPPDRARRDPTTQASSVERDAATMPSGASVDVRVSREFPIGRVKIEGLFEVFNLFNRTNYTEINNIFGVGAYPGSPLPTYGQFTQAGPPRQVQLAFKLTF